MKRNENFMVQCFHSADSLVDNAESTTIRINWEPDYWLVVLRCTFASGRFLDIYPSSGLGGTTFRLGASGTLVLPVPAKELTIKTTLVTGNWSAYAVKNLDGFIITS